MIQKKKITSSLQSGAVCSSCKQEKTYKTVNKLLSLLNLISKERENLTKPAFIYCLFKYVSFFMNFLILCLCFSQELLQILYNEGCSKGIFKQTYLFNRAARSVHDSSEKYYTILKQTSQRLRACLLFRRTPLLLSKLPYQIHQIL